MCIFEVTNYCHQRKCKTKRLPIWATFYRLTVKSLCEIVKKRVKNYIIKEKSKGDTKNG
jgi:hypothetical protein